MTKSSYTAKEDFTRAKMIVDELSGCIDTGVTLETLSSLLGDDTDDKTRVTSWGRVGPGPWVLAWKWKLTLNPGVLLGQVQDLEKRIELTA